MGFLPEGFKSLDMTPAANVAPQPQAQAQGALPEVLLLIVTTAETADVTYLLIKAEDADQAVTEGNAASNNDLLSYEGLAAYFGVIRRSLRLENTKIFRTCIDLINYCCDAEIDITTEQAIKTPQAWQTEFFS